MGNIFNTTAKEMFEKGKAEGVDSSVIGNRVAEEILKFYEGLSYDSVQAISYLIKERLNKVCTVSANF